MMWASRYADIVFLTLIGSLCHFSTSIEFLSVMFSSNRAEILMMFSTSIFTIDGAVSPNWFLCVILTHSHIRA